MQNTDHDKRENDVTNTCKRKQKHVDQIISMRLPQQRRNHKTSAACSHEQLKSLGLYMNPFVRAQNTTCPHGPHLAQNVIVK